MCFVINIICIILYYMYICICVIHTESHYVHVHVFCIDVRNARYNDSQDIPLGPIPPNNPNRMYIDPRTYASMNHAFEQNSVREIPPKEIANMDEIGVGK